jgi:hypothetical protein
VEGWVVVGVAQMARSFSCWVSQGAIDAGPASILIVSLVCGGVEIKGVRDVRRIQKYYRSAMSAFNK